MSLLERAQARKVTQGRPAKLPDGMDEVAVAWAFGEVSYTQIASAMKCGSTGVYSRLCHGLKQAVERGLIVRAGLKQTDRKTA